MTSPQKSTAASEHFNMDYEWRQKIQMPTAYRIGNSTVRLQTKFVTVVAILGLIFLTILYFALPKGHQPHDSNHSEFSYHKFIAQSAFNSKYPLSEPKIKDGVYQYRIAIVTDLDRSSKLTTKNNTWISYLYFGNIHYDPSSDKVTVDINDKSPTILKSSLSQGGRGMELSELVTFNGNIYSIDDRTGVVYKIVNSSSVIPWVLLNDGDGDVNKGFKSEWAAVKGKQLYVGGLGKVWTSEVGEVINHNPQWVKVISMNGEVQHVDWQDNYNRMRSKAGIEDPGYVIHESATWSDIHRKWFFLPRRASTTKYNDVDDEKKGTNLMFQCDEDFENIIVSKVGTIVSPTHGFSSFKFMPNSQDRIIVALKSEEDGNTIASYIIIFTIDGKVLYPETKIGNLKFEGIDFI